MSDEVTKKIMRASVLAEAAQRAAVRADLFTPTATARLLQAVDNAQPALRVIREMEQQRKGVLRGMEALSLAAAARNLTPTIASLEAASSFARFADIAKGLNVGRFVLPDMTALTGLSAAAAAIVKPYETIALASPIWATHLAERMRVIPQNWALEIDLSVSAEAFAHLSRFSDLASTARPYADETTVIVIDELGQVTITPEEEDETAEAREARYDDAGRDPALIAFPQAAYGGILVAAGFTITFPEPPTPAIEAGLNEPISFNPQMQVILTSLEGHLRQFIVERLTAQDGDRWLRQRVHGDVRKQWLARRAEALAANKPAFAPIHYANFMELADIMTARLSWDQVFSPVFLSKEALKMSLLRLYGLRNDIAHSRPTTMSDDLMLVAEATFLFRALGVAVTYN